MAREENKPTWKGRIFTVSLWSVTVLLKALMGKTADWHLIETELELGVSKEYMHVLKSGTNSFSKLLFTLSISYIFDILQHHNSSALEY